MTSWAIIGGGIGGLALAHALVRQGKEVFIYERAAQFEDIGAGLQLSPNATRILDQWGLLPQARECAFSPTCLEIRRLQDTTLLKIFPMGQEAERRWGAPFLLFHRHDLHALFLSFLEKSPLASLKYHTYAQNINVTDEAVHLSGPHFSAHHQALICADGLHSYGRRFMCPELRHPFHIWSGLTAWRALISRDMIPKGLDAFCHSLILWMGSALHAVTYPLRGGTGLNIVLVRKSKKKEERWEDIQAELQAHAPVFAACTDLPFTPWPLYTCPPLPRWSQGPVTLLGDAAHPLLPFLAQGACQAIEDAAILAQVCAGCVQRIEITAAFKRYERLRYARAAYIQNLSLRQSYVYHPPRFLTFLRDLGISLFPLSHMQAQLSHIYAAGWEAGS